MIKCTNNLSIVNMMKKIPLKFLSFIFILILITPFDVICESAESLCLNKETIKTQLNQFSIEELEEFKTFLKKFLIENTLFIKRFVILNFILLTSLSLEFYVLATIIEFLSFYLTVDFNQF
jgi:hypothetical protein